MISVYKGTLRTNDQMQHIVSLQEEAVHHDGV